MNTDLDVLQNRRRPVLTTMPFKVKKLGLYKIGTMGTAPNKLKVEKVWSLTHIPARGRTTELRYFRPTQIQSSHHTPTRQGRFLPSLSHPKPPGTVRTMASFLRLRRWYVTKDQVSVILAAPTPHFPNKLDRRHSSSGMLEARYLAFGNLLT